MSNFYFTGRTHVGAKGGRLTKLKGGVASIAPGMITAITLVTALSTSAHAACVGTNTANNDTIVCEGSGTNYPQETFAGDDSITVRNIVGPGGIDTIIASQSGRGFEAWSFRTGADDDTVIIEGGEVRGLTELGEGDDTFRISGGTAAGVTSVGDGDDTFIATGGVVSTTVSLDDGDDTVLLSGGTVGDLDVGAGDDSVEISGGSVLLSGPSDADVRLGSGNDTLTLSGGQIEQHAYGGDGNDTFTVSNGTVERLIGEDGNDTFIVTGGEIFGIDGGNDDDTITVSGGRVSIITAGSGDDQITVSDSGGSLRGILAGDGADTVNVTDGSLQDTFYVDTGEGNDQVSLDIGQTEIERVRTGAGDDVLSLSSGIIQDRIQYDRGGNIVGTEYAVETDSGNDEVSIDGAVTIGTVATGSGDDTVVWSDGDVSQIDTDVGADTVTVTASQYDGSQVIDGGEESSDNNTTIDTLTLEGVTANASGSTIRGFEVIDATQSTLTLTDVTGETLNLDGGEVTLDGTAEFGAVNGGDNADTLIISSEDGGGITNGGNLGAGDDVMTVEAGNVRGVVETGTGNDTVNLEGGNNTFLVRLGDGDDVINQSGGTYSGDVFGGTGNDTFNLTGGTYSNDIGLDEGDDVLVVDGGIMNGTRGSVSMGDGDDTVRLESGGIQFAPTFITDDGAALGAVVSLGEGDNTIAVSGGEHFVGAASGSGDDTFQFTGGTLGTEDIAVFVAAGDGEDTITLDGSTIYGQVSGGFGNDTIHVNSGSIYARSFNSNPGAAISGFDGEDQITVTGGLVEGIDAGAGNDTVVVEGGDIDDVLALGEGDDTLTITDGALEDVEGGIGDDVIAMSGGRVTDTIRGNDGNDIINFTGGEVNDIRGDAGDDTLNLTGGEVTDEVIAGDGDDTILIDGVTISGRSSNVLGGTGDDTISLVSGTMENNHPRRQWVLVDGGEGDDIISAGNVTGAGIFGADGNDQLSVSGGEVAFVEGGDGNDILTLSGGLIGGFGTDSDGLPKVSGDAGDDTIALSGAIIDGDVDAGAGDDQITMTGGSVAGEIFAGDGDDSIVLDGASIGSIDERAILDPEFVRSDDFDGAVEDLEGGEGNDTILLLSGIVADDVLGDARGAAGGDDVILLNGATVSDEVIGGGGADTITLNSGLVGRRIDGGDGDDTLTWNGGSTLFITGRGGADRLLITATEYDGTQRLNGGEEDSDDNSVVDTLDLSGVSASIDGTVIGFERTTLRDGTFLQVTDMSSDELVVSDAVVSAGLVAGEAATGTVTGSMAFGAESVLAVDFADYDQADRFDVSGDVSFADGASIAVSVADRTQLRDGESFTVVDAEGTLNVGRVAIEDIVGLYNFVEQVDGNALNLTTEMVDLGDQGQAGGAIEDLFEDDHAGAIEQLLAGTTTEEEVHAIVDALSPSNVDAVGAMQTARARQLQGVLRERMSVRGVEVSRASNSSTFDTAGVLDTDINVASSQGGWAQVLSFQSEREGSDATDDFTSDAAGFVLGYDRVVQPGTLLGVALSTVSGDARTVSGAGVTQTETEGFGLDIYGAQAFGNVIVRGSLGYDSTSLTSLRSIAGVVDDIGGKYDATNIRADIAVSRDYTIGDSTFRPFAGLAWDRLERDAYTEDHGDFGLSFDAHSSDTFEGYLGLAVQKDFDIGNGVLGTELRGRVGYDLNSTADAMTARFNAGGDSFSMPLSERDDLRTSFGFSVGYAPSNNSKLVLDFDTEFAGDYTSQSLRASYRFEF